MNGAESWGATKSLKKKHPFCYVSTLRSSRNLSIFVEVVVVYDLNLLISYPFNLRNKKTQKLFKNGKHETGKLLLVLNNHTEQ